jgi:hypothetical protein
MSDQSQGPGWWIASDGKWYPPQSAAPAAAPKKRRTGLIVGVALAVVVVAGVVIFLAGGSGDDVADIDTSAFEPESFDDAEALVQELNDQGVECGDFEELEASAGVLELNEATSSGQCTSGDTVLLVDIYENDGDGEDNLDRLVELSRDCEFAPDADGEADDVSGGNWLVGVQGDALTEADGHGELVDEVAAALFGESADLGCED